MSQVDLLIDELQQHGLERFRIFYIGLEGVVVDNKDPQGRGRIQCKIPNIADDNVIHQWIRPTFEGSGVGRGTFWPPEVGDIVRIHFDRGRPDFPLYYIGGHYYVDKAPSALKPTPEEAPRKRGFQTRAGHFLVFDDTPDSEAVTLHWHKPAADDLSLTTASQSADPVSGLHSLLQFLPDGSIALLADSGSQRVVLDTTNKQIQIQSAQGAGSTVISFGDGVDIRDHSGTMLRLSADGIQLISAAPLTVSAPTVNLAAGGVSIGSPSPTARLESVVLGDRYTQARTLRATAEKAAWAAIGAAARTAAATAGPAAGMVLGGAVLGGVLTSFFTIVAGACDTAGQAISVFESGKSLYLSKKNKAT